MRFINPIIFITGIILCSSTVWCHGVKGNIILTEGYLVTAQYDDGEAMSYSETEIKSSDSQLPFQKGRTDRNGCMMFKPDRTGKWQVVVNDGMGHRLALDLTVEEKDAHSDSVHVHTKNTSGSSTRAMQIVTGLSIILGISGFLFGWKNRRSSRSVEKS